jgi:hypothetical protein
MKKNLKLCPLVRFLRGDGRVISSANARVCRSSQTQVRKKGHSELLIGEAGGPLSPGYRPPNFTMSSDLGHFGDPETLLRLGFCGSHIKTKNKKHPGLCKQTEISGIGIGRLCSHYGRKHGAIEKLVFTSSRTGDYLNSCSPMVTLSEAETEHMRTTHAPSFLMKTL